MPTPRTLRRPALVAGAFATAALATQALSALAGSGPGTPAAEASSEPAAVDPAVAQREAELRATMQSLFGTLRTLLPLAASPGRWAAPDKRALVERGLEELAAGADALRRHTLADDPEARFYGQALELDVRAMNARFRHGHIDSARELVLDATATCVACHTRLPEARSSALSVDFIDNTVLKDLPADERFRIQLATRRFEDALTTAESMLADPKRYAPNTTDVLTRYVVTSVRAQGDLVRPRKPLQAFAARPDSWGRIRGDIASWEQGLKALESPAKRKPSLAAAKKVLKDADKRVRSPADRSQLVRYAVASGMLHTLAANPKVPKRERAEACLLLVRTDLRLEGRMSLALANAWLEEAVLLAPRTEVAEQAYDLLEEITLAAHAGPEQTVLPEDEQARLARLERLARRP